MEKQRAAQKKASGGVLPKLLLLLLLLLVGAHLLRLHEKISSAESELQSLSAQVEAQQQENDELEAALGKADDPEYLQELAREQYGMALPGEKIFIDISN